ncbi:MAG: transposase, partial [Verrucomicrobiota bacterium]|nr:transposase [Verrucomicrobiota bacterium]
CSSCGHRQRMKLEEREYRCGNCSMNIDRDLNSAILEKAAGMSVLKACGAIP